MLTATVCGSFRRHLTGIYEAVHAFAELGVTVLSPSDPRVVDAIGDFVFVASDRGRSRKLVEDRHLAAIGASDFVWLVAPDGYVGPSAALELGYALASSIPVYCDASIFDQTLRMYVRPATTKRDVVRYHESHARASKDEARGQLLLDPDKYGNDFLERAAHVVAQASDAREIMLKPHTESQMDPVYVELKTAVSKLLLPHD